MNRKELVDAVALKQDMTKKDARPLVDAVFEVMSEALINGDNVLISGFGTFRFVDRAPRKGVSPSTGEYMIIPATKTVLFKPSEKLKDAMND